MANASCTAFHLPAYMLGRAGSLSLIPGGGRKAGVADGRNEGGDDSPYFWCHHHRRRFSPGIVNTDPGKHRRRLGQHRQFLRAQDLNDLVPILYNPAVVVMGVGLLALGSGGLMGKGPLKVDQA